MQTYRTNPPSRNIAPRPALGPGDTHQTSAPRDPRLGRIERIIRVTGIAPSRIGRTVCNHPDLIAKLRDGRQLGNRRLAQLDAWLATQEANHA